MIQLVFTVGGILLAASPLALLLLVAYSSDDAKRLRAFDRTPTSPIARVQPGVLVKLTGRIRASGPLLSAPFTGRACVFYELNVTQNVGATSDSWTNILSLTDVEDFLIEDESGAAFVRIRGLRVFRKSDAEQDATPDLHAWLARRRLPGSGDRHPRRRYREAIFEPGETVSVLGVVAPEHHPDSLVAGSGYRDMQRRLVITAPAGESLVVVGHREGMRRAPGIDPSRS